MVDLWCKICSFFIWSLHIIVIQLTWANLNEWTITYLASYAWHWGLMMWDNTLLSLLVIFRSWRVIIVIYLFIYQSCDNTHLYISCLVTSLTIAQRLTLGDTYGNLHPDWNFTSKQLLIIMLCIAKKIQCSYHWRFRGFSPLLTLGLGWCSCRSRCS